MVYLLNRYTNNNVIQQSTTLRHSFIWVSVLFHYLCRTERTVTNRLHPKISTAGIRNGCLFCYIAFQGSSGATVTLVIFD